MTTSANDNSNISSVNATAQEVLNAIGELGSFDPVALIEAVMAAVDERLASVGITPPAEGEAGDGQGLPGVGEDGGVPGQPVDGEAPAEQPIPPSVATELAAMREEIAGVDTRVAATVTSSLAGVDSRFDMYHAWLNRLGARIDALSQDNSHRQGYGGGHQPLD